MDQDDPEKRIADLERRLAEPRASGDPAADRGPQQAGFPPPHAGASASSTGGRLTAEQVHNVAFSKPPLGKRGYHETQVDAFLDLVEAALQDPGDRTLTPDQVRNVAFSKPPFGKRGYNETQVDAFLDLVEAEVRRRHGAP